MAWTRNVFSSHVESISYDDEAQTMTVTWKKSKKGPTTYEGVSEELADEASRTVSVGTFLHEHVKGKFEHGYKGDGDGDK